MVSLFFTNLTFLLLGIDFDQQIPFPICLSVYQLWLINIRQFMISSIYWSVPSVCFSLRLILIFITLIRALNISQAGFLLLHKSVGQVDTLEYASYFLQHQSCISCFLNSLIFLLFNDAMYLEILSIFSSVV